MAHHYTVQIDRLDQGEANWKPCRLWAFRTAEAARSRFEIELSRWALSPAANRTLCGNAWQAWCLIDGSRFWLRVVERERVQVVGKAV